MKKGLHLKILQKRLAVHLYRSLLHNRFHRFAYYNTLLSNLPYYKSNSSQYSALYRYSSKPNGFLEFLYLKTKFYSLDVMNTEDSSKENTKKYYL